MDGAKANKTSTASPSRSLCLMKLRRIVFSLHSVTADWSPCRWRKHFGLRNLECCKIDSALAGWFRLYTSPRRQRGRRKLRSGRFLTASAGLEDPCFLLRTKTEPDRRSFLAIQHFNAAGAKRRQSHLQL